jgi:hypothetical protein
MTAIRREIDSPYALCRLAISILLSTIGGIGMWSVVVALPAVQAELLGMALGGWMSGVIFDLTGSYRAAFANGVAWNGLNLLIAIFLLIRSPSEHARYGPKKDMSPRTMFTN